MLENLEAAQRVTRKDIPKPFVTFDGDEGAAVTPGFESEPENFDEFLIDAGLDPKDIEVIPPVRTSRWQQQKDGDLVWLTSYRFTFRRKNSTIDLPLLIQSAKEKAKSSRLPKTTDKAIVILWSDLQVGKVDIHGGSDELVQRVVNTRAKLLKLIKQEKPERAVFVDLGDTVENFTNKADQQQLYLNDLSIMQQIDLATSMAWDTLKEVAALVPKVTYASVGSNHCQWRVAKQHVGKGTDDWGVFIGRQLARLAKETKAKNIRFIEPAEWDESLSLDVFDDQYHILGIVHGHQVNRPDNMSTWWRGPACGSQPVAAATTLCHGHFHHMRITELGMTDDGRSRFIVGAPTMDNGSNWFRTMTGEQATPGLATFILEKHEAFSGTVFKL